MTIITQVHTGSGDNVGAVTSGKPNRITLTGREIRDLAIFAGYISEREDKPDEDEIEYTIEGGSHDIKRVVDEDEGIQYYHSLAYITDYPEEGCYPLGEKINN